MCMAEQVTAKKDAKTQQLKVPPHSFEAEQSVLGGLMLDNEAWDRVAERVIDKDFYSRPHRLIFQAMTRLSNAGNPIDLITLQEELERSEQLEESGGFAYLVEIAKNTPSAANINAYPNGAAHLHRNKETNQHADATVHQHKSHPLLPF